MAASVTGVLVTAGPTWAAPGCAQTPVDQLFRGACCDGESVGADACFEPDGVEPAEQARRRRRW